MGCRLGWRSIAKGAGLEFGQNYSMLEAACNLERKQPSVTSKSINGPLLELLERNICCGRICVKVQAVGILRVLELGRCKLLLAVVDNVSPLGVDSVVVVAHHGCCRYAEKLCCFRCPAAVLKLVDMCRESQTEWRDAT